MLYFRGLRGTKDTGCLRKNTGCLQKDTGCLRKNTGCLQKTQAVFYFCVIPNSSSGK